MFKALCYILATVAGLCAIATAISGSPILAVMNAMYVFMLVSLARD